MTQAGTKEMIQTKFMLTNGKHLCFPAKTSQFPSVKIALFALLNLTLSKMLFEGLETRVTFFGKMKMLMLEILLN